MGSDPELSRRFSRSYPELIEQRWVGMAQALDELADGGAQPSAKQRLAVALRRHHSNATEVQRQLLRWDAPWRDRG